MSRQGKTGAMHYGFAGTHALGRVKRAVKDEIENLAQRGRVRTIADMSEEEIAEIERSTGMRVRR